MKWALCVCSAEPRRACTLHHCATAPALPCHKPASLVARSCAQACLSQPPRTHKCLSAAAHSQALSSQALHRSCAELTRAASLLCAQHVRINGHLSRLIKLRKQVLLHSKDAKRLRLRSVPAQSSCSEPPAALWPPCPATALPCPCVARARWPCPPISFVLRTARLGFRSESRDGLHTLRGGNRSERRELL